MKFARLGSASQKLVAGAFYRNAHVAARFYSFKIKRAKTLS
jgi:hypothetical protein